MVAGVSADDYERLVAAHFAAAGYVVERNVQHDALEIDLVATKFCFRSKDQYLVEAKSGKAWGHPDAFKLLGWMTFLAIDKGLLVVADGKDGAVGDVSDRFASHGIEVLHLAAGANSVKFMKSAGLGHPGSNDEVDAWARAFQ